MLINEKAGKEGGLTQRCGQSNYRTECHLNTSYIERVIYTAMLTT